MIIQAVKPNKITRLVDDLLAAFPQWKGDAHPTIPGAYIGSRLSAWAAGDQITLDVPDGTDPVAVQAVIDAHDPVALSIAEQVEQDVADATTSLKTVDIPTAAEIEAHVDAIFPSLTAVQRNYLTKIGQISAWLLKRDRLK